MNIRLSLLQISGQTLRADPTRPGLQLAIGELVHATLVEMADDRSAILQIRGETVRAQLQTPLPKGAIVPLVVIGQTDNGMWELKVSPFAKDGLSGNAAPELLQQAASSEAGPQSLSRLLQNLGLRNTPLTRQIVSRLLNGGQSVTPVLVQTIEALLEQAAEGVPQRALTTGQSAGSTMQEAANSQRLAQSLDVLVEMARRNIPLTAATFQAVKALWNGPSLSELLTEASVWESLSGDHSSPATRHPLPDSAEAGGSIPGRFDLTGADTGSAPMDGARGGTASARAFHASTSTAAGSTFGVGTGSGLDVDGRATALPKAAVAPRSGTAPEAPASVRPGFPLADVMLELERFVQLSPQERVIALQSAVRRLGLDHEHKLGLLQRTGAEMALPDTLKSVVLTQLQAPPNDPALDQILQHLTGQQLMHSRKDDASPFFYHFFALPIRVGEQPADAKIHLLTRKKAGKHLDPFNCYLYFQLQLPTIGKVGVHVQVVERLVSIRLIAEADVPIRLDGVDLAALRQGLQQAGYQLGTVRQEIGKVDGTDPFFQANVPFANGTFDLRA
ncbi:hypothetical protein [Effusibacillus pohliae]|uniref:hypothetical protein n=1 Tax=Effusibacillus pohliae TaxID=232270 RepID=UPI00037C4B2B|nr:hypothetical protein [Effusibacillus pohliae]